MTAAPARPPAGRYPEQDERSRRRWVIGLWSIGLIGVAGVVWMGLGMARTPVTWQDVGFRIDGDTIEVTYDVIRIDPQVAVRCRLEALNVRHAQVGVVTIDVPPGTSNATRLTTPIRTSEEPVTGVVDSCWVASD